ncbi:MAG: hypothetical protein EP329_21240 [Deltaproteobacteria bacterium]|nr:MAG: hypothetical protein EP329_21240 [Deltaproteobacteria bacterium]
MTRFLAAAALAVVLSSALGACTDDCQRLADLTCQKAGDGSEECKKIRERTDSPSAEDKEMCAIALDVFEKLANN